MRKLYILFAAIFIIQNCSDSNPVKNDKEIIDPIGTTYFISSSEGNDLDDGLTKETPWQSFANLDSIQLQPGDSILLKAGDVWYDELHLTGKGRPDTLIVLTKYGSGNRPRIERDDLEYDHCVVIESASYWHISELDCRQAKLGIYLRYHDSYDNYDVTISDCYFQDMYSETIDPSLHNYEYAWSAGIFLGGHVWNTDSLFVPVLINLTIQRCGFMNTGVGFINNWYWPDVYRQRLQNVLIEYCRAEKCVGGGVAMNMASGTIRYNKFKNNGGYFQYGVTSGFAQSCEDLVVEMNEISYTQRQDCPDGTAFDFEGDNRTCIFRNNYVHDNDGAAILVMSTIDDNVDILIENNVIFNNCLNASKFDYRFEMLCHDGSNTGIIRKNQILKSEARKHFSENWANFEKTDNTLENYNGLLPEMPFEWPCDADANFRGMNTLFKWGNP